MKIEFLLEEIVLLSAKYIKLINKKGFDKIVIKSNDIKRINILFNEILNRDLIIRVCFKSLKNDYIFNVSNVSLKTFEIILFGTLNNYWNSYDQGYIDNFKLLTEKRGQVKWYELNDKQKYLYLRGCNLLNGVRETIDNMNDIIIIDLSKVITDLDVYYEIGRAFFKSYGYFGTEINSFIDCLCNIDESLRRREKMPVLKIKGYKNFEKHFSNNILFIDFYDEFTKSGFKIENSK